MRKLCSIALAAAASALLAGHALAAARPLDAAEKQIVEKSVRPALSDPAAQITWLNWNGGDNLCGKVGYQYFTLAVSKTKAGKIASAGQAQVFRPGLGPITMARVASCEGMTR